MKINIDAMIEDLSYHLSSLDYLKNGGFITTAQFEGLKKATQTLTTEYQKVRGQHGGTVEA